MSFTTLAPVSELAVRALLVSSRNLGFHRPRGRNKIPDAVIADEFALRMERIVALLSFREKQNGCLYQTSLEIKDKRSRHAPRISLKTLLKFRRRAKDRSRSVDLAIVQDVTMVWAGTLVSRGFRETRDFNFLNKLKLEVEWLLSEFGYSLSMREALSCPFIISWHRHPMWKTLCLADGASEAEVKLGLSYARRDCRTDGCSGYSTSGCGQSELSLTA